jgi:hypothetical protein
MISGIVAAEGSISLKAGTISPTAFYQSGLGSSNNLNKAAIDAIFTYKNGQSLAFDLAGDLDGLALILADMKALQVGSDGNLTGPMP